MTQTELLEIFAARFTADELAQVLDMLAALLNVEKANARMAIAQAQATQAQAAAETIRQTAQVEANAAREAFAALVAAAA